MEHLEIREQHVGRDVELVRDLMLARPRIELVAGLEHRLFERAPAGADPALAFQMTQRQRDRVLAHLTALPDRTRAFGDEASRVREHAHVIVVAACNDPVEPIAFEPARQHTTLFPVPLATLVPEACERAQA